MTVPRRHLGRAERVAFAESQGWRCKKCRCDIEEYSAWRIDHIVPLGLDGADDASNWQLLCWDCNRKKTHSRGGDLWEMAKADRTRKKYESPLMSARDRRLAAMEERRDGGIPPRQTTEVDDDQDNTQERGRGRRRTPR